MMIIYKTTNLVNGKIYVGQHYTNCEDGYLGSGNHIKQAIEKYGRINFTRETLCKCETQDDINIAEQYWIKQLNSQDPSVGYNITDGGEGWPNGVKRGEFSDGHKQKLSESHTGKKLTEEHKANIGKSLIGHKHTEESKQKMSKSSIGKPKSSIARKHMSKAKKGQVPWNKGKIGVQDYSNRTKEHNKNISKALTIHLNISDIVFRRNNGEGLKTIASDYNVSIRTIQRRLKQQT